MCFLNTINLRIRTVSWRCAAIPTLGAAARSSDCRHTEKAACTPTIFKCRQPSAGNRKPTPLPVGEGKTRRRSEQKFVPPEEALTLTLSHGRGDRFVANSKKAACTLNI